MNRLFFPFLGVLVMLFQNCNTKSKNAVSQNIHYPISMQGFDSLKLGMTKAELEAMMDTSFTLKHIKVDDGPYDTINTKYKGKDITVYLYGSDDERVATV